MAYATPLQEGKHLDYIAGDDAVNFGDIISVGGLVGIADHPIEAGATGAVCVQGVYNFTYGTSAAITAGTPVYWDATNHKVTVTPSTNTFLGITVYAAASGDATVSVLINAGQPQAAAIADAASTVAGYQTINDILAALRKAGIVAPNAE